MFVIEIEHALGGIGKNCLQCIESYFINFYPNELSNLADPGDFVERIILESDVQLFECLAFPCYD